MALWVGWLKDIPGSPGGVSRWAAFFDDSPAGDDGIHVLVKRAGISSTQWDDGKPTIINDVTVAGWPHYNVTEPQRRALLALGVRVVPDGWLWPPDAPTARLFLIMESCLSVNVGFRKMAARAGVTKGE
jgi:hypothetical protein